MHAEEVLVSGVPRAVEYDMRGPDDLLFGVGTGCEGAMRVLLEPPRPRAAQPRLIAAAARTARQGLPTGLVVVHEAATLNFGTYSAAAPLPEVLIRAGRQALSESTSASVDFEGDGRRTRALVQFLAPSPHLLVCGAGPDALPLVSAAAALGWRVTVVDDRPAHIGDGRFAGAQLLLGACSDLLTVVDVARCHATVVMSHHLASDAAYLRELAAADVPAYVGLFGPEGRCTRLMQNLGAAPRRCASEPPARPGGV
jgi:xanthine/CO dehydrogenase XdhC/CoxF family maturation factor